MNLDHLILLLEFLFSFLFDFFILECNAEIYVLFHMQLLLYKICLYKK